MSKGHGKDSRTFSDFLKFDWKWDKEHNTRTIVKLEDFQLYVEPYICGEGYNYTMEVINSGQVLGRSKRRYSLRCVAQINAEEDCESLLGRNLKPFKKKRKYT